MPARDWERLSACAEHDLSLWFPVRAPGQSNTAAEARAICASCPAFFPCLEDSLSNASRSGVHQIRAGAGENVRRGLRRLWVNREQDPEAWEAALERHLRRLDGEKIPPDDRNGPDVAHGLRSTYNRGCRCVPCRWAAADDVAEKAAARREAKAS